jgi:hypothetical protein
VATAAVVISLFGGNYRTVTTTAFIAEMLMVLVSARTDRRPK